MSELVQVRKLGVGEAINQVYSSYEEMIRDVKAKLTVVEGNILKARWLVGWQAFILMDDRKYGDHSVEEFATSLDMSTSSVYECKRFYESFSKEELNGVLIQLGLSYRKSLMFSRCDDPDQRICIATAAGNFGLCDTDIKKLVDKANEGYTIPQTKEEIEALIQDVEEVVDTNEEVDVPATVVKVDDEPEEYDEELETKNAVKTADPEKAIIDEFESCCGAIDMCLEQLNNNFRAVENRISNMDALTGLNYKMAEKRIGETAKAVQNINMSIFKFIKMLNDHNIRPTR